MNAKPTRDALGDEMLKLGLEHDDIYVIDCDVAKSCKTRNLWRDFLNFPYFTGFSAH